MTSNANVHKSPLTTAACEPTHILILIFEKPSLFSLPPLSPVRYKRQASKISICHSQPREATHERSHKFFRPFRPRSAFLSDRHGPIPSSADDDIAVLLVAVCLLDPFPS